MATGAGLIAVTLCYIIGVTSLEFKHHSQPEIDDYFDSVLQSYPDLTRLYSIGQTVEGIL